jgi:ADP-ribosylglycohydrolase
MIILPADYEERVYAGVLGKIIGVYLGRPFEGWHNKKIEEELGEIQYYVHEKRGVPLVVADDDISGTFTFLRALPDHGDGHALTAEQIGQTWLNYLIERRTILWWGGIGVSTEHTAYERLKHGIPAPRSGSIALNGTVVAEQIGAQIFIDGWAMVCPGDPEKAVALAGKAASVSHDGEAVYGAQVVAAIESQAFVESDLGKLLDTAITFIPRSSLISHVISDLREWKEAEPNDWRATFRKVEDRYGYDKYGGGCHMIPNHAVIILALLYGEDDFQRSLMIANTAGWDTDCNSGNVGCIMGIKNGLRGIDRMVDFRSPVADRMYLTTADGGRCVTDAVRETYEVVNTARALQGQKPILPNQGMRFHFNLPGAWQGFLPEDSPEVRGVVHLRNTTAGRAKIEGPSDERMLAIHYDGVAPGRVARVSTPTFLTPDALKSGGYFMMASPFVYPGQIIRARILADESNERTAHVRLYARVYGKDDKLEILRGELCLCERGEANHFHWEVPDTGGRSVAEIGVEIGDHSGTGTVYLDWLGIGGTPRVTFRRPEAGGTVWRRAWVNAVDDFREWGVSRTLALVQNEGTGLVYQGESSWSDYTVTIEGHAHLADAIGVVACVRGLRRYIAVRLEERGEKGRAVLAEQYDDHENILAEVPFGWDLYQAVRFSITTRRDGSLTAHVGSDDSAVILKGSLAPERARGAAGMLVHTGHCQFGDMRIEPAMEHLPA